MRMFENFLKLIESLNKTFRLKFDIHFYLVFTDNISQCTTYIGIKSRLKMNLA